MLEERSFNTGVVEISYVEGPPSGPPLVLLHGFTGRWQHFLPVIPALYARWHFYAPDCRGHGKSGRVPGQYMPKDYMEDAAAFVQHVVSEPAVLFAHSLGGVSAVWVAGQMPDKVRAVIIGDTPLSNAGWAALPDTQQFHTALRGIIASGRPVRELVPLLADVTAPGEEPPTRFGDLPDVDGVVLREWARTLEQLDPDVVQLLAEGRKQEFRANFDMDAMVSKVSCPVLLLQGNTSLGGIMTDEDVEHVLSTLPEAYCVKIDHAGHDLGLSTWQVAPLLTALTNFLESL